MELINTTQPFIGIDIGGTLMKIVMESGNDKSVGVSDGHPLVSFIRNRSLHEDKSLSDGWKSTVFSRPGKDSKEHLFRALIIPTTDIEQLMNSVETQESHASGKIRIAATGGGAHKYKDELERRLNVQLLIVKELEATAHGLLVDSEQSVGTQMLLCNVGTGVSLATVDEQGEVERVSGSGVGGATFWGLVKRLTQFSSFNEAILAAHNAGVLGKTDTLVEDIYGRETSKEIGLAPDLVAGFLGKLDSDDLTDADISAGLLRMFASNLGQLAVFQARLIGVSTVWFAGGFVQSASSENSEDNTAEIIQNAIGEAVSFWSAGKLQAQFPRNAALLGAMGAVHVTAQEQ
ncbi:hypothetical protein GGF48_005778 [Coemansia sp. RSA 921]|nr:hypothetical protein GGF48_005778 [Coemansia sp. RSA 921]KAJ2269616.1 hypothetical protein J3F81_004244 [Coemansia sp. RSA 371]